MAIVENAQVIEQDLQWLQSLIDYRLNLFFHPEQGQTAEVNLDLPAFSPDGSETHYARFIQKYGLSATERLVILLALAPEVKPELLDRFLIRNSIYDKTFAEFGGIALSSFNGFMPTVKTALFILGGATPAGQLKYTSLFDKSAPLYDEHLLKEIKMDEGYPAFHRHLALSESALNYILTGEDVQHEYGMDFPARQLTTLMEWDDLILHESTRANLTELLTWPEHGQKLINELQMKKTIQAGYRALFHGPSGTGKTLTAALIGKKVNRPVYRIDLSQLVSKYIGETEKNLEKIFTVAESRDWILFFDEADALFGKRTGITSSNDRFANQETAYLLQRVEVSDNIVILATNLKSNLDEAFTRRFQSIVFFPMPTETERLALWQNAFSSKVEFEETINFYEIAKKYDIAGGSIVNVVRYATLMAVARGTLLITHDELMEGIKREYAKLGRTI